MAESTILPLIKSALLTLSSPVIQETEPTLLDRNELGRLSSTLSWLTSILQDAESLRSSNRAIGKWIGDLKDVLYDLDDTLDKLATETLQGKEKQKDSLIKKISKYFSSVSEPVLGEKLKRVCANFNEVSSRGRDFGFREILVEGSSKRGTSPGDREIVTLVRRSNFIGRDNDKEELIKRVLSCRDHLHLSVIPVLGVGGIGKTMLAKLLMYEERITSNFEMILWASFSGKSDLRSILEEIIKSGMGLNSVKLTMEESITVVRRMLVSKRYFLVLDDVWMEDSLVWNTLKDILDIGSQGSAIVATTRSYRAASYVGTETRYNLNRLSDDDCWSVFKNYAFIEGDDSQDSAVVKTGKSIANKCSGVPLAAEIVGSLLSRERDVNEWHRVERKFGEILVQKLDRTAAIAAMRLCYDEMPSHLKACLSFLPLFPKDHTVYKDELENLWMAQGLLGMDDRNEEPEDAGDRFFGEILSRSLFRNAFLVVGAGIASGKLHDMVYDFLTSVTDEEFATNVNCGTVLGLSASDKLRHIGFYDGNLAVKAFPKGLLNANKARTFMFLQQVGPITKSFLDDLISNFKCLRALSLMGSEFDELPSSIGSLTHLRYLSLFSNFNIKVLPNSLCKLINLQILDLRHCEQLKALPKDIGNLVNLRHLYLTSQMTALPEQSLRCLTSLRVLKLIDCGFLTNLTEWIGCLTCLTRLAIARCPKLASLPRGMQSLTSLKVLAITDCERLDLGEGECLQGLKSLTILDLGKLPKLLRLPLVLQAAASSLRHLMLGECNGLTALPEWLQQFTSLEKFYLYNCTNISVLPEGFRHLSNLKYFDVRGCQRLSRRCMKDEGEDWSLISHIPVIAIDGNWIQMNQSPW